MPKKGSPTYRQRLETCKQTFEAKNRELLRLLIMHLGLQFDIRVDLDNINFLYFIELYILDKPMEIDPFYRFVHRYTLAAYDNKDSTDFNHQVEQYMQRITSYLSTLVLGLNNIERTLVLRIIKTEIIDKRIFVSSNSFTEANRDISKYEHFEIFNAYSAATYPFISIDPQKIISENKLLKVDINQFIAFLNQMENFFETLTRFVRIRLDEFREDPVISMFIKEFSKAELKAEDSVSKLDREITENVMKEIKRQVKEEKDKKLKEKPKSLKHLKDWGKGKSRRII
jgi:hypothetical protein